MSEGPIPALLRFTAVVDDQPPFEDQQGNPCPCRELDGFEAPLGHPSWSGRTPPLHVGCRCVVEVVRFTATSELASRMEEMYLAQLRERGFPSPVFIDDKCDGCGPDGRGRRGISFGADKPVLCTPCMTNGMAALMLDPARQTS